MKFRDGMWLVKEGLTVEYAREVYSVEKSQNDGRAKVSLLCPTKVIYSRADTLNTPTVTIDLEAVIDGVISLTARHWKGALEKGPFFELFPDGRPEASSNVKTTDAGTTLSAGDLSVTVSSKKHAFDLRFNGADGKQVTSLLDKSIGFAYSPAMSSPKQQLDTSEFKHYLFTQHTLGVGEKIYGLGERFTEFNKRGQEVSIWNEDGGTSSEQAYKNIPFYISSNGYGVFIDHAERVDLEIGSERSCRLQCSAETHKLKWYIIYGPDPKEILRKYAILTGFAPPIPTDSFGLWLSTSFTTDYDESTVMSFIDGMYARNIPVKVFHFDCFWMPAFHWCDFVFSRKDFPDPKAMITRIKERYPGIKISAWINPYLGDASPVFEEAAEKGYLVKRTNGDVWQWDLWQGGMGLVDFTNPDARDWYVQKLEYLFDVGVDYLKTDFGERIPEKGVVWFDKSLDLNKMHNYYTFIYNKVVFEAVEKHLGRGNAVLFARSATAGTQRFPLQWGGDCESTFEAMHESLRGGLSLALSGFAYWSVDIGGFEGNPGPEIYKRWVAWGLMLSHSRLHGSNSYRVPWLVDEQSVTVLQKFTELKLRLLPYLYTQSLSATKTGVPLLRAMFLEFPSDPTCWFLDAQYMLGESLLVAPVFSGDDNAEVTFYLPEGRWTNFWTGDVVSGPGWKSEKHGFESLVLYVREGTTLIIQGGDSKELQTDYLNDKLEVWTYQVKEKKETSWLSPDGQEGGRVVAEWNGDKNTVIAAIQLKDGGQKSTNEIRVGPGYDDLFKPT